MSTRAGTPCVLGVDIGTQSTKALLVAADGRILARHGRAYRIETPQPLWAQQWPQVWLQACVESIRGAMQAAGVAPASVHALALSSLGGGSGIPVDEAGQVLHPCLIWLDRRAEAQAEWVRQHLDVPRLQAISGNRVDSCHGFTKILWLRERQPDLWPRIRRLLPPNSWINAQFTGCEAVDHSSAGNIGGVYDITRRAWSAEALRMLGIPASLMPERLLASHETVGPLRADWAARLGLQAGMPVLAGGVDAAFATLAAGATRTGQHVAMLGTSMCWGTLRRQVDASDGLLSFPHVFNPLQDLYVFGGAMTAGASVSWFIEHFCAAERAAGQDVHALLEREAAALPAGGEGLLFLPYLMGERSPVWDASASGAFIGLGLQQGRAHLYRAVLEGVACALRHTMEAGMRGVTGLDEHLVVVGGASHSDLWMQIVADVTGRAVHTIAEEVEAPLGAALLAAWGVGLIDEAGLRRGWVRPVPRAQPRATNHARCERLYAQFRAAYPALAPVMRALRG